MHITSAASFAFALGWIPAPRISRPWVIAATAHPYKFADIVEPLIGRTIDPSPALAGVLDRSTRFEPCAADLDALKTQLNALNETA